MLKLYALVFVIGIIGIFGYGAKYYYDTTQNKIAILTENNAQLEVAVQTANESLETAIANQKKLAELNNNLQSDLQKAEQYGDSLRSKLAELDLVRDALLDAKNLEGRMNEENGDLAFVALSMQDYENLALNISELRRYINQQKNIIIYYEKAVTEEPKETK